MIKLLRRMAARAPTYLADARQDPRWLIMFIFGRFTLVRRLLWPRRQIQLPSTAASVFDVQVSAAVGALKRDGIYSGLNLPLTMVSEILIFANTRACFANFDRRYPFSVSEHANLERYLKTPVLTGHFLELVEECPTIVRVRSDPVIQAIAGIYLASGPKLISTRLWWSFPAQDVSEEVMSHASQGKMHFDLDDWRTIKFFFYLTDVELSDGPHLFVKGTHLWHKLKHQITLVVGHAMPDVVRAYGIENLLTVCGKAGFGFAEDPFAFHMGAISSRKPRLMLEIGYGVSAASSRRFYGDLVLRRNK